MATSLNLFSIRSAFRSVNHPNGFCKLISHRHSQKSKIVHRASLKRHIKIAALRKGDQLSSMSSGGFHFEVFGKVVFERDTCNTPSVQGTEGFSMYLIVKVDYTEACMPFRHWKAL